MEASGYENHSSVIYCESHAPLKIKRTLENNWKSKQEEIAKFCRGIEKYYSSLKYKAGATNFDPEFKAFKKERKKQKET